MSDLKTLSSVELFKINVWPLKKLTANYNWKCLFKSQKTNKEAPNAISILNFLAL